jgi:Tfp pilus assembly protein PilF
MPIANGTTSSNRIGVVVLGFANCTGDTNFAHWRAVAEFLFAQQLLANRSIHLYQDIHYAMEQCGVADGALASENQAYRIGEILKADWVIWGGYERPEGKWMLSIRLLNVAVGGLIMELKADSVDWQNITALLADDFFYKSGTARRHSEPSKPKEHLVAAAALEAYAKALWLSGFRKPLTEQEKSLRDAIGMDPQFADPYVSLAALYSQTGRIKEAEGMVRQGLGLRPDSAFAHKWLAIILALEQYNLKAEMEFRTAVQLNPDDPAIFAELGDFLLRNYQYSEAIEMLNKALELNPHGAFVSDIRNMIAESKAKLNPTYVSFLAPRDYTARQLEEALCRELTPEERTLVTNPLQSSSQMEPWAHLLTRGAANEETKAKRIFETLAARARSAEPTAYAKIRTASEVFAVWNTPGVSLYCQDYALLYVSLARSVGIKAYQVDVREPYDQTGPHACAAVIVGNKRLLVDPAWQWFGVPHPQYVVLDDLQAIGVYVSELPDMKFSVIACKLAPNLPIVQLNLFEKLLQENRRDEARGVLSAIKQLHADSDTIKYAEADLALHGGKTENAIGLLRQSIATRPNQGTYHNLLAEAYVQEGKLAEAREAFRDALRCPLTTEEAERIKRRINEIESR